MNEPLEALLRAASEADGTNRIEYRDRIAAHGAEAVRRLEPWLRDRRLERFAIVTIAAAGACGATAEARAALRRAQPSDPSAAKAIADALAKLVGTREAKASNSRPRQPS